MGIPFTDFVRPGPTNTGEFVNSTTTNRYVVGGSVGLRLPLRLGIEFDVLYRHLSYEDRYLYSPTAGRSDHVTTGALEFPVLLKYHFYGKVVKPYLIAGPTFDVLVGLSNAYTIAASLPPSTTTGTDSSPRGLQNNSGTGFAAGAALDIHAGLVCISPEFRYNYWRSRHFSGSNQNQAELLVGISF